MLKKRIIPVQLLLDGRLVKTVQFGEYRDVGDPVKSSQVYNSQYADELIFLNIDRTGGNIAPMADLLENVSKGCFMPLAVGGGIRTFEDVSFLIKNGADKVVVNTQAYDDPDLITRAADTFGSQAVTVAVDVVWDEVEQRHMPMTNCGRQHREVQLQDHIQAVIEHGAGEVLIQSIDRDGMMDGYDIPLIKAVMEVAAVPIIALGGSGNYEHLRDAFLETDVSALACGSLFNFSDSNPMRAKNFLANYGLAFKKV